MMKLHHVRKKGNQMCVRCSTWRCQVTGGSSSGRAVFGWGFLVISGSTVWALTVRVIWFIPCTDVGIIRHSHSHSDKALVSCWRLTDGWLALHQPAWSYSPLKSFWQHAWLHVQHLSVPWTQLQRNTLGLYWSSGFEYHLSIVFFRFSESPLS